MDSPTASRLMDKKEVLAAVKLSYPTLWNRMRKGLFPLGISSGGRTFWHREEVEAYISALPRQVLKKADPKPKRGK